jgi:hypothetical protein
MGMTERTHTVGNYAQYIAGVKELISFDWHDEDKAETAA